MLFNPAAKTREITITSPAGPLPSMQAAWFFLAAWTRPGLTGRAKTWIQKGAAVFSVFIFHTTVLRQLENTPLRATLFIIPTLILVTFALVWLLDLILRPNWLRIIFGLPEKLS